MENLSQNAAIVTGGGTGIGAGIALALAREGIRVAICGRRSEALNKVATAIKNAGGVCLPVQADVSKAEDVDRVIKATLEAYGQIDILINNAAVGGGDYIHQHSIEEWDRIMAINLRGPFLMCRGVLPHMRARRHGHIINISSESGLEYYQSDGAYGVSKHALNAFSEYVQRENQELGIRVNVICPGMVVTDMTQGSPGLVHEKCLYPDDIADLTLWLLTRRRNIKIGTPVLIQTMLNPWQE